MVKKHHLHHVFSKLYCDPVWVFRLPALALIGGIILICFFIINTNRKVAAARAKAVADAALKKKQ